MYLYLQKTALPSSTLLLSLPNMQEPCRSQCRSERSEQEKNLLTPTTVETVSVVQPTVA